MIEANPKISKVYVLNVEYVGTTFGGLFQVSPTVNHVSLAYAVKRVWKAGSGFSLANIGYASITGFLVLLFMQNNWGNKLQLPSHFLV